MLSQSILVFLFIFFFFWIDLSLSVSLKTLLCYKLHNTTTHTTITARNVWFDTGQVFQACRENSNCAALLSVFLTVEKKKSVWFTEQVQTLKFTLIAAATETDAQLAEVITHVKLFACVLKQELCLNANEPHNEKLYNDCHYWMLFMWH